MYRAKRSVLLERKAIVASFPPRLLAGWEAAPCEKASEKKPTMTPARVLRHGIQVTHTPWRTAAMNTQASCGVGVSPPTCLGWLEMAQLPISVAILRRGREFEFDDETFGP
ncbi:hypothetical protein PG987_015698 [Apiospora arundinis]